MSQEYTKYQSDLNRKNLHLQEQIKKIIADCETITSNQSAMKVRQYKDREALGQA